MRLIIMRAALLGMAAAALTACHPSASLPTVTLARVDPEEAAERAVVGSAVGTALGTAIGASFSINPAIGAVVGAEAGATIGAGIGAATAQPLPVYKPIAVPAGAVIPGFYDTWAPGYQPPAVAAQTPPPSPRG